MKIVSDEMRKKFFERPTEINLRELQSMNQNRQMSLGTKVAIILRVLTANVQFSLILKIKRKRKKEAAVVTC
jgi:hypothetical protein